MTVINIIMAVDSGTVIVAAVVIVVIVCLVFINLLIGSQVYFLVLFICLVNRLGYIRIVELRV